MGLVKKIFMCCVALLLSFSYPLYAASSISVTTKQRVIPAQERGIVTLPFTIVNRSTKSLTLNETIALPKGWRILANRGPFTLAPREETLRLVHVLASSEVPAGNYTIPYLVVSQDDLTVRAEEKINVIIHSTSKLLANVLEKPAFVLSGEEYSVQFRVENKGNTPTSLNVKVKDISGYVTGFEPKQLQLKPSDSAIVTIKSLIPADLTRSFAHTLKLSLRGKSIAEDRTINTQVIPRIPEGTGRYHTLPTRVTSNYINDGDSSILQAEVTAKGSIDEQGEHYVDLLYRDVQSNTASSLGNKSEKHITYQYNAADVHLGDRTFYVTGITDNGFYGQGAEVGYSPANQNWNIRAFSAEQDPQDESSSASGEKTEIQGLEIGYQFNDNLEFIFNMLSSDDVENSQRKELLQGFELNWDKYSSAEIRFSVAQDKDGKAFQFEQNGTLGAFSYGLEVKRADAAFDGRISDIESQSFTGLYYVNDKQSYFRANIFHGKTNLDRDNAQRMPEDKNISLGFGHYFEDSFRNSLYAEVFKKETKDRRSEPDFFNSEQGMRLDYQKSVTQALRLNAILEYAQKDNRITLEESDQIRWGLTAAYTPSEQYQFGFNIDNSRINYNLNNEQEERLSYGLNASVQFNPGQRLSGYWRYSESSGDSQQNLHLSYSHTFRNGISLGASVSTDLVQNDDDNDLSYLVSLSMPFDTPLYKYNNIGSVTGKIIDSSSQRAIPDTVVSIAGQYAVSDENGRYQFKAIREGKYTITTDLSRTGYSNYFIEDEKHREVMLAANQATNHNITLAPGTGISGQVLKYTAHPSLALQSNPAMQNKKGDEMTPDGGISSLLITLVSVEDNNTVYKTLTNEGGYYHFNGLKSGQWQILVSDPQNVIDQARLEKPQRTINLKVGEEKTITFKAIPLIKKIKKIGPSSGFTVSGE